MKKSWKLVISLLIPQLVAITAGLVTAAAVGSWYRGIVKPSWNPPSYLFGPVWTVLYLMMGYALFLIWTGAPAGPGKRRAIVLWSVQLFLNFCWSLLFFGLHLIGGAVVEIVLLWLLILITIFAFARFSKPAAWLLVPYIAWVTFASVLCFTIWTMNGRKV